MPERSGRSRPKVACETNSGEFKCRIGQDPGRVSALACPDTHAKVLGTLTLDTKVGINLNRRMTCTPSPSTIGAACNCLAIRRAARGIARRYDEALRPLDLNNGQFSMLTAIAGLQPAGIQRIGDLLGMDRTTVTAALKPLERRGLVEIAVTEEDQRGRAVRLTQPGADLLGRAIPLWQATQQAVADALGGVIAAEDFRRQLTALG